MGYLGLLLASTIGLAGLGSAQQYAGDNIPNQLPAVGNTEIAFFRIPDPAGKNNNLTLINYYGHGRDDKRIVESKIQRAVIVVHGLNRDPQTYEANAMSALNQVLNPDVNFDSVAVIAPYFANGDDKNVGYPWTTGLPAGQGSTTNALVWPGSQWSAGGNAQYPYGSKNTISSFYVLDTLVKYFDNATLFPNLKQIVVAGHSLGAQTVHRYAVIGNQLNTRSPVTYWVGNPNSYIWLDTTRPFDTTSCPAYDTYRDGFTNFTQYPMTYATALVAKGRAAILDNFNTKQMAYARGVLDQGDDSSNCAPFTTGANRNERFFNFIKKFPLQCKDPKSNNCDTVDLLQIGHDNGAMMASPAGQARLFTDNFYGNNTRSYDFGYPRVQAGDDPYPDPALNNTRAPWNNNTYAGGMTYYGCWTDQQPLTLPYFAYDNSSNSIEFCTSTCNALGYSIAGVEYSSQCYCGNALSFKAQQVVEASCNMACAANSNETCGGIARTNIFSRGTPKQLTQPMNVATIGSYKYSACYTEVPNRIINDNSITGDKISVESCYKFCNGYKYFGLEYGQECYCGNVIQGQANTTAEAECSYTCSGNNLELCGASGRMSLYVYNGTFPVSSAAAGADPATTATTASTPATTAVGPISCPANNGQIFVANGMNFLIECGVDHYGGDMANAQVKDLQECITTCATTKGCVDVSLAGTACYLKSALGGANNNANVNGAKYVGMAGAASTSAAVVSTVVVSSSLPAAVSSTAPAAVTSTAQATSSKPAVVTSSAAATTSSTAVATTSSTAVATTSTTPAVGTSTKAAATSTAPATSSTQVIPTTPTTTTTTAASTTSTPAAVISTSSTAVVVVSKSTSSGPALAPTPSAVSCPASNNTLVNTFNGATWFIECGMDHYGGDMGLIYRDTFFGCITGCANTTGCIDVAYAGTACYMKSSIGDNNMNGVWGARLYAAPSPSAATSTSVLPSTSLTVSTSTVPVKTSTVIPTTSSAAATSAVVPTTSTVVSMTSSTATTSTVVLTTSTTLVTSTKPATSTTSTTTPATSTTSTTSLATSTTSTTAAAVTSTTAVVTKSSAATTTTTATYSYVSGYAYPTLAAGFSYVGCYQDGGPRAMPWSNGSTSTNTPQKCAANCRAMGYKYSGTEYSSECYCSNYQPSVTAPDTDCASQCSGDSKQNCGGGYRLSVVADSTWVQTLFARQSYKTWNLQGCFADDVNTRALANVVPMQGGASNATIANCLTACTAAGYKYCGAEYYSECYGANVAPKNAPLPGSSALAAGCDFPCTANSTEACGGNSKITIYINNGTSA